MYVNVYEHNSLRGYTFHTIFFPRFCDFIAMRHNFKLLMELTIMWFFLCLLKKLIYRGNEKS